VAELKRLIQTSDITSVDDEQWGDPLPTARRQELEIKIGNEHIAFTCAEMLSLTDIRDSTDPQGLTILYYLTQDLKCFVMSLINLHFKIKPIPS
jgi:protein mago nashi